MRASDRTAPGHKGVLVVGATGGSGEAVVRVLAGSGYDVTFSGRRPQDVRDLESRLPGTRGIVLDAGDAEAARAAIAEVDSATQLVAYVHLAGGYAGGTSIEDLTDAEWAEMTGRNWTSLRNGASIVFGMFKRRGAGSIVTMGSLGGLNGGMRNAPYAVSKAAVIAFTRCLAEEGQAHGVRANCIVPGIIDTSANRAAMPGSNRKGWVDPSSLGDTIAWLCGTGSHGVSGTVLMMRGGA